MSPDVHRVGCTPWAFAAHAAMLRPMSRPNSVLGLFRKLVVTRWEKLSLNVRLALVAAGLLLVAAIVSAAFGLSLCPTRGGCCTRGPAAAEAAPLTHPAITAGRTGAHGGCPFSGER